MFITPQPQGGVRVPWPSFPKFVLFALRRLYRQTAAFGIALDQLFCGSAEVTVRLPSRFTTL
jgi:hypothetical protein